MENNIALQVWEIHLFNEENPSDKRVEKMNIQVGCWSDEKNTEWLKRCYKNWYSKYSVNHCRNSTVREYEDYQKKYWMVENIVKTEQMVNYVD